MEKVLDARMTRVMWKLISHEKSNFVKSMQLINGMVSINEVLYLDNVSNSEYFVFKVYFEKTYDSARSYEYRMQNFGFDGRSRVLIRTYVF